MSLLRMTMLSLFVAFTLGQASAAETLELDAEKSTIGFVGKKTDGQHSGGFKKFSCAAVADFEKPENGSMTIDIDATSLWSDDEKLTNHLKNPDFFDVRKFPKITFKSTGIDHSGGEDKKATLIGELTMLGKTSEVKVPCTVAIDDKTVTVDTAFAIDRTRWGMTYGEGKIKSDVDVTAHLVFNR